MSSSQYTYTFVVNFRGGVNCSQVRATDLKSSLYAWHNEISKKMGEITFLGEKTLQEINKENNDPDNRPIQLQGLKNIWCTIISTKQASLLVNIIRTDISGK
jgi:hypothetical protein